jgi:superoxide dismutase, Cu-Zn family
MRTSHLTALAALAVSLVLAGCTTGPPAENTAAAPPGAAPTITAMADLSPTAGNTVRGTVAFTQEAGGVHIVADLSGLTPGDHGFHIHETGDCSAPDAASAGEHFNPSASMHGAPDAPARHAGDLGNITADASGNAKYDRVDPGLTLEGEQSVIGRSVVVHVGADDMTSQPSGASGARAACGVISRPGGAG